MAGKLPNEGDTPLPKPTKLTVENLEKHESKHEVMAMRQFACGKCQTNWWREVPAKKPVSKCKRCYQKYDALPREKEFGIGVHKCACGHSFTGWTSYGTKSPCYKCGAEVLPEIQPKKNTIKKKTHRRHKCEACNGVGDCPNKKPLVHVSEPHISTGSTISSVVSGDDDDPHASDRRRAAYGEFDEEDDDTIVDQFEDLSIGEVDYHSD